MNTHVVHGALISTDASFRESVKQVLGGAQHGVELSVEIAIACTEISAAQVEELRRVTLDLVLLDLERDPVTGIKFAHFLAELDPHRQLVATGPPLSPDLLLEAMRAGISEYLPKPVTPEALRTGIHRVMRKLGWTPSGGPQPTGRLYALFSPKGGCGCTTAATNLAIVLHRLTGKKTLLVDLDLPSLRNLQRCLPLLERTAGKAVRDRVRIVVNRYVGDDVISLGDVHRTLGMKVSWTLSNDYVAVSRSINAGKPVVLNGRSPYTRDLQALGADLVGARHGSRAGGGTHAGWRGLGRLWRRLRRRREAAEAW